MKTLKSSKAVALVSTALLISSLFWLMNTKRVNGNLEEGLKDERLKSESLLSEKLSLEKEIEQLKVDLLATRGKNQELDKEVESALAKMRMKDADYNRIKKQSLSVAELKKQKLELIALLSKMENDLEGMRLANAELAGKNKLLSEALASAEERNSLLSKDLSNAMLASLDQSQIQAVRGKSEKVTARARRTQKLMADFELASDLKTLGFRIIDPTGNVLSQEAGTLAFSTTPADNSYVASTGTATGKKVQKVNVSFAPRKKLRSGLYTVEILNENLHIASLRVKLK
jgi:hypothetical protein